MQLTSVQIVWKIASYAQYEKASEKLDVVCKCPAKSMDFTSAFGINVYNLSFFEDMIFLWSVDLLCPGDEVHH